ncbi:MAG TPA: MBL fold metallo-hydrolase [Azospirillaceae bacterium]|nr:MBL fold metallo-hydrolase [Azospirillaceae bacterium]
MRTILAAALACLCLSGPAAAASLDEVYDFTVERVTDRVHRIYRPDEGRVQPEGNVTVVEQADGLVVIDTGGTPSAGERVVALIRTLSAKPVRHLVLTHYHGDHNLGAPAFLKAWPDLTLISTAKTRENMLGEPMAYIRDYGKGIGALAPQFAKLAARDDLPEEMRRNWARAARDAEALAVAYEGVTATPALLTFEDRLVLHDAEAPVELLFLGRAHTDGDAVAWLPKQRVLATGDIVVAPFPFAFNAFLGEWMGVLHRLRGFDFAYLVPGHGMVQRDKSYLDRLHSLVGALRDQVGPPAREGLPLAEVRKRVDLERQGALFTGDSPWNKRFFRDWFIGPGTQAAWQEARGEPIVPGAKIQP